MNAHKSQQSVYKYFICLSITFSILFLSQVGEALAQKVGTLEKVEGNVRVFAKGSKRGKKGRNGMALFVDSTIKTQTGAKADIQYSNGDTIRLVDESEATLKATSFNEGAINGSIDMGAGKFFYMVNAIAGKTKYTMNTPSATAGIKGTFGFVRSSATKSSFLNKVGRVFLRSRDPNIPGFQNLGANSISEIPRGKPPTPPRRPTPVDLKIFTKAPDLVKKQEKIIQQKQGTKEKDKDKDEDKKDEDKKDKEKDKDKDKKDEDKKDDTKDDGTKPGTTTKTDTNPDQSDTDLVGNVLADEEVEKALANGDEDIQNKVGSPSQ